MTPARRQKLTEAVALIRAASNAEPMPEPRTGFLARLMGRVK